MSYGYEYYCCGACCGDNGFVYEDSSSDKFKDADECILAKEGERGVVLLYHHLELVPCEEQLDVDNFIYSHSEWRPECGALAIRRRDYDLLRKKHSHKAIDRLMCIHSHLETERSRELAIEIQEPSF